eukprot:5243988-Pyramimonas_sp.AAC.1
MLQPSDAAIAATAVAATRPAAAAGRFTPEGSEPAGRGTLATDRGMHGLPNSLRFEFSVLA